MYPRLAISFFIVCTYVGRITKTVDSIVGLKLFRNEFMRRLL